jgi:hypothetical protein
LDFKVKTTVELPDELARRIKAEAALRGRKLKDLIADGLRLVLEAPQSAASPAKKPRPPTAYDLMKDDRGIVGSGIGDLATNTKHMKGFGRASRRNR